MTITASDVKDRFPEFASVDSTTITRWIEEAERNHNACQWGEKSDDALSYLTAHFLVAFGNGCSGQELGPGPLTGTAMGGVSASWSPMNIPKIFSKDDLGTTKYGRRYHSILKTLFVCRCT